MALISRFSSCEILDYPMNEGSSAWLQNKTSVDNLSYIATSMLLGKLSKAESTTNGPGQEMKRYPSIRKSNFESHRHSFVSLLPLCHSFLAVRSKRPSSRGSCRPAGRQSNHVGAACRVPLTSPHLSIVLLLMLPPTKSSSDCGYSYTLVITTHWVIPSYVPRW